MLIVNNDNILINMDQVKSVTLAEESFGGWSLSFWYNADREKYDYDVLRFPNKKAAQEAFDAIKRNIKTIRI